MSVPDTWYTIEQFVQDGHGGAILTSTSAVKWALRMYSSVLISAGVVVPGAGRRPTLVSAAFTQAYVAILAKEAMRAISADAARRIHHNVTVNGVWYRSVRAAFVALDLPEVKHEQFRLRLKAARTLVDDEGRVWKIAERKAAQP